MKYISYSDVDTKQIAFKLANNLKNNIIALTGSLGAGKTTFAQGFAEGLGIKDKILSPTFVIQRIHKIPNSKKVLHHIDLYRLENEKDFENLGFYDLFSNLNNIVLIEWAEKISHLPKNTIKIKIEKKDKDKRIITIS